ncbi:MAG: SGNH/GDSL hydrolase family protein [bacterium]|nr:SGNH/GDSL hydrolase family protein [bacterium]
MKSLYTLSLRALLLASLALPALAQPQFKLSDGDRIVFLGDSITQLGAAPEGYVTLFKLFCDINGYEVDVINSGISGHKSNDMLARLDRDVLAHKPTWVSISCGVNDVWHNFGRERGVRKRRGIPLDQYQANMTAMVEKCQAAGIQVLLLTATPIYEDLDSEENLALAQYNKFLHQLAKDKELLLCDLNAACQHWFKQKANDENLLTTDGVHMNPRGNRLMTRTILTTLGAKPAEITHWAQRVELINNMQPTQ